MQYRKTSLIRLSAEFNQHPITGSGPQIFPYTAIIAPDHSAATCIYKSALQRVRRKASGCMLFKSTPVFSHRGVPPLNQSVQQMGFFVLFIAALASYLFPPPFLFANAQVVRECY